MADNLGIRPEVIRRANIYKANDKTPYGKTLNVDIAQIYDDCVNQSKYEERLSEISHFNQSNSFKKRGISVIPVKYGCPSAFVTLNRGKTIFYLNSFF